MSEIIFYLTLQTIYENPNISSAKQVKTATNCTKNVRSHVLYTVYSRLVRLFYYLDVLYI